MGAVSDARRHYQAVLDSCTEKTLREIAEQGLQQCRQVELGHESEVSPPEVTGAAPGQAAAAMPWMEKLVPEVVEEPEQLEVAQADPRRGQEVELRELASLAGVGNQAPVGRTADPLAFDPTRLSARELEDLSRGLLRVRLV
jgi:hypothetical protein